MTAKVDAKLRTGNRLQIGQKSDCESLQVQEDFDISRFLGRWNEIFAYPYSVSLGARCVTSTYTFDNDQKILIYSRFVDSRGLVNRMTGIAYEKGQGVLSMTIPAIRLFSSLYARFYSLLRFF